MLFVEANEIVPNLWQGSFPQPGGNVRASGFKLLVLCAVELQRDPSDYPGVEVLNAPNYDHIDHKLNAEDERIALDAGLRVEQAVRAGQKTLVTCRAGMNRSGFVTGIALHLLFGWDGDSIIRLIRKKRPMRNGHRPLSNADFTAALRKLTSHPTALPGGWQQSASGVLFPV